MVGTMIAPTAAVVAGPEPEMAPKNMQVMTVTMARPPVRWPTRESKNSTSRLDRPPPSIRAPDRMKKGMAIRGKESQEANRPEAMYPMFTDPVARA